ncbi:hypothetical protein ACFSZS_09350 [Seohaeicola zhoushanensis]
MRQDRRFAPGQAISAPLFARFLGESFDWLITVDPHLHRIKSLNEVFSVPAIRVATAPLIADWIASEVPDAVLIGPDNESRQWVAEVAAMARRPFEVLDKQRSGDRSVEVTLPVLRTWAAARQFSSTILPPRAGPWSARSTASWRQAGGHRSVFSSTRSLRAALSKTYSLRVLHASSRPIRSLTRPMQFRLPEALQPPWRRLPRIQ